MFSSLVGGDLPWIGRRCFEMKGTETNPGGDECVCLGMKEIHLGNPHFNTPDTEWGDSNRVVTRGQ